MKPLLSKSGHFWVSLDEGHNPLFSVPKNWWLGNRKPALSQARVQHVPKAFGTDV